MQTKTITFPDGRTVCAIGQGTWNIGKSISKSREETEALLTGIDLGMEIIDTAELYGNEEFIGSVIKNVRHKVFLISKVLPENANTSGTIKACEASLQRLGTDYLDMYLLHWKGWHPFAETVEAMQELQKAGKIKSWGVSNIDIDDMSKIYSLPGGNECATNQVLYNLSERGVEYDLIPWSSQKAMPVMAYSPVGEGRLTKHPVIERISQKHFVTPAQIALAWTIRQPGIISIPKAGKVNHVKDNYGSLSIVLDNDDLQELDNAFPPPTGKIPLAGW